MAAQKGARVNFKRRSAPVSKAMADGPGTTLKPLSAPVPIIFPMGEPNGSSTVTSERGGVSRVRDVLHDMTEQVRQLAATIDSLRREMR
jgi:hypothetical protein